MLELREKVGAANSINPRPPQYCSQLFNCPKHGRFQMVLRIPIVEDDTVPGGRKKAVAECQAIKSSSRSGYEEGREERICDIRVEIDLPITLTKMQIQAMINESATNK